MEEKQLKKYSPFESKHLTQDEIAAMADFTFEDLKQLATAYPQTISNTAYLVLKDTSRKEKDQLHPLSTWPNLVELWKVGQKNFVAHAFKASFKGRPVPVSTAKNSLKDITPDQVKQGLKVAPEQTAKEVTTPPADTKPEEPKIPATNEAKAAKGPKEKTPEQIAAEELKGLADAPDFNAMEATKDVLLVKYKDLFGKSAKKTLTVPQLRKEIIAELKKK